MVLCGVEGLGGVFWLVLMMGVLLIAMYECFRSDVVLSFSCIASSRFTMIRTCDRRKIT